MKNEIMVSINCITYNHEKYIADAIESFLMQKTNFKYEILIHDDASTDKTPDIIRVYGKKYPALIKPIYQKENQYSKGIKVGSFNRERAKGKYLAICEGDDYWIDPHKLQKQVDYMEAHPECSMCVHAAYRVDVAKRKMKQHERPSIGNKNYKIEDVIMMGHTFATNSILYPAKFNSNLPDFYQNAPIGDHPLVIYLSLNGEVYYIDEFMSAYRIGVDGSWTTLMTTEAVEKGYVKINKVIEINESRIKMLDEINEYTGYRHNKVIQRLKKEFYFDLMVIQGRYQEIRKDEYKEIYDSLDFMTKMKLIIKEHFPGFVKTYKSIQRKCRS